MKQLSSLKLTLNEYFERYHPLPIDLERECFAKQFNFLSDPSPFVTGLTSRRAGKTTACAFDLLCTALNSPGVICLYITLARVNASRIIWPILKQINLDYKLQGDINETTLSIKFPNDSIIYCSGAKDQRAIDKFLGLPLKLVYIDEAQSFRSYLDDLIDRVLAPALLDHAGSLKLIGTPGPVPIGTFYNLCRSAEWSHHSWTFFDNPWIASKSGQSHEQLLERELKRKGVTRDDPTIQREFFGAWVFDTESLVFKYDRNLNHYSEIPTNDKLNYILGIDIGFDDSDALAVLGYNDTSKTTFLIDEGIRAKQGITELVDQINQYTKRYEIHKIVMDFGGLGKKIAEEIIRRYGIPVQAAEKSRKHENIELFNDALRTGMFKAKHTSRFAQDCMLLEWDHDKSTPDRRVVSDRYHSDICDAVLYGWRESFSYANSAPETKPKPYTPLWYQAEAERMETEAEEHFKKIEEADEELGM